MWKRGWIRYGAAGSILTVVLVAVGFHFELKTADWASWVQAVGSIVAITTGFILADRQSKIAALQLLRERMAADVEHARCVLAVAIFVEEQLRPALDEMRARDSVRGYLEVSADYMDFDGAKRAIDSIPLFQLRSSDAIKAVLLLDTCLNNVRHMTNFGQADPAFASRDYDDFKVRADEVLQALRSAFREIIRLAEQSHSALLDHDNRHGHVR